MKKLFFIVALVIGLAAATPSAKAQSDSPEYRDAVRVLLELTDARQTVESTLVATYDNMGLKFKIPTSEVVQIMFDRIWDKYVNDYSAIYSKFFTLEEVNQLCEFYKTPLGEKLVKNTPVLTQESMTVMQQFQSDIAEVLTEYIKK